MSNYYKGMSEEFKQAVEVIKENCQFEDCDIHFCCDCIYPLSVIRCGDNDD